MILLNLKSITFLGNICLFYTVLIFYDEGAGLVPMFFSLLTCILTFVFFILGFIFFLRLLCFAFLVITCLFCLTSFVFLLLSMFFVSFFYCVLSFAN